MGLSGNITSFVDFKDAINSAPLNQRFLNRFPIGIYYGADLTIVSNTSVTVGNFDIEITDGTYLMKSSSSGNNTVTVSTINPIIVFRWAYTGTVNDVPSILAVSSAATNDLVIGQCTFAGSTLTGFNLANRNDAPHFNKFCLVEALVTPAYSFKVRAGSTSTNTTTYFIPEQVISYPYPAPSVGSRIDVIVINSSGAIAVIEGTQSGSPSAPSIANNVPLAQVTLQTSSTVITNAMITDTRSFLANIANYMDLSSNQSASGTKTFTGQLVIPAVTSDPGSPVNGQIWLRTDF